MRRFIALATLPILAYHNCSAWPNAGFDRHLIREALCSGHVNRAIGRNMAAPTRLQS